ncbi:MAG: hypothetical protein AAFY03_03345 [Pseudomonadota bacterium]
MLDMNTAPLVRGPALAPPSPPPTATQQVAPTEASAGKSEFESDRLIQQQRILKDSGTPNEVIPDESPVERIPSEEPFSPPQSPTNEQTFSVLARDTTNNLFGPTDNQPRSSNTNQPDGDDGERKAVQSTQESVALIRDLENPVLEPVVEIRA